MSHLSGLTLIGKNLDLEDNQSQFINLNTNDTINPIFQSGIALDIDNNKSVIQSLSHGKFSKLSLTASDIETGTNYYLYIDSTSGEIKSRKFEFESITIVNPDNYLQKIVLDYEFLNKIKNMVDNQ